MKSKQNVRIWYLSHSVSGKAPSNIIELKYKLCPDVLIFVVDIIVLLDHQGVHNAI